MPLGFAILKSQGFYGSGFKMRPLVHFVWIQDFNFLPTNGFSMKQRATEMRQLLTGCVLKALGCPMPSFSPRKSASGPQRSRTDGY